MSKELPVSSTITAIQNSPKEIIIRVHIVCIQTHNAELFVHAAVLCIESATPKDMHGRAPHQYTRVGGEVMS